MNIHLIFLPPPTPFPMKCFCLAPVPNTGKIYHLFNDLLSRTLFKEFVNCSRMVFTAVYIYNVVGIEITCDTIIQNYIGEGWGR